MKYFSSQFQKQEIFRGKYLSHPASNKSVLTTGNCRCVLTRETTQFELVALIKGKTFTQKAHGNLIAVLQVLSKSITALLITHTKSK